MKYLLSIAFLVLAVSCNNAEQKSEELPPLTEQKAFNKTFMSLSDLNDCYFTLTENNQFEYYKMLLDSIKNTEFTGQYKIVNDTIYLTFDKEEGKNLLGYRVIIDENAENIVFIDAAPESRYMHLFN